MNITGGNALISASAVLDKAKVGDGTKIADLGCGISGHYVFPASKRVGKRGIVYAIDILKNILDTINKRARLEKMENLKTVWSDLEMFGATKIESGSLDAALLANTLYQSHKRPEIIREGVRLLKKGGLLLIVEWKDIALPFGPSPEERVKQDLIKIAAPKLGLELEEEFEPGPYHYGLVFKKL